MYGSLCSKRVTWGSKIPAKAHSKVSRLSEVR